MQSPHDSRRKFISKSAFATAALALPTFVPAKALGRDGTVSPSEKITLGVIGIGPRCTYDLTAMLKLADVQCVAIADVQASRRDAGKKLVDDHYGNQDCKLYRDFRELLSRKDIDAVLIATGDRWHSPASILAAEAGKDVYSEKPCGLTIAACQELADTIRRTGRVFQAGTQRRSVPNFQQAIRLAHSGKLGKLQALYASVYTPAAIFPMLPEALSTDLTSLNEDQDRIAVVSDMVFETDGSLATSELYRARVLNHGKLAYRSVAAWYCWRAADEPPLK